MRFPRLRIGQAFLYEGKKYTKTGPMTASQEDSGKNCMIRRSAEITPLEGFTQAKPSIPDNFSRDQVIAILKEYKSELKSLVLAEAAEQDVVSLSDLLLKIDQLDVSVFLSQSAADQAPS
jgi:hypothetical protein